MKTLKFYCEKILPVIYDDALSYYEVLCKVVEKLNECVLNINSQNVTINEIADIVAEKISVKPEEIANAVNLWLESHPEYTTTVIDGSITASKIEANFLKSIKNDYVTPQMYGAVGDGITDDSNAFQNMFNDYSKEAESIKIPSGIYFINNNVILAKRVTMFGDGKPVLLFGANGCITIEKNLEHLDNDKIEQAGIKSSFYDITFTNSTIEQRYYETTAELTSVRIGKIFNGCCMYLNFTNCKFFRCGTCFNLTRSNIVKNIWWGAIYFSMCEFNRCNEIFHKPDANIVEDGDTIRVSTFPINQVSFNQCFLSKSNFFLNEITKYDGADVNSYNGTIDIEEFTFNQCDIEDFKFIYCCFHNFESNLYVTTEWVKDCAIRNLIFTSCYLERFNILNTTNSCGLVNGSNLSFYSCWIFINNTPISFSTPIVASNQGPTTVVFDNNLLIDNARGTGYHKLLNAPQNCTVTAITTTGNNRINETNEWVIMTNTQIYNHYSSGNTNLTINGIKYYLFNDTASRYYTNYVVQTNLMANIYNYSFINSIEQNCLININNQIAWFKKLGYGGSSQIYDRFGDLVSLFLSNVRNVHGTSDAITAFKNNTKLSKVRWLGTPANTNIPNSDLFDGCSGITDIYVPWEKHELDGTSYAQEWVTAENNNFGCPNPNVTIHYNSTV